MSSAAKKPFQGRWAVTSGATRSTQRADAAGISLAEYQRLVDFCAEHRLNMPIANGSAKHARILIAKLFEVATKEVCLVSGSLTEQTRDGIEVYIYEPLVARAKEFLRRPGSTLSIIIQSGQLKNGENNGFIQELARSDGRQGRVEVYVPTPDLLGESAPHFMVADGSAFRLETGQDAKPRSDSTAAVANFGDSKSADGLLRLYEELVSFLKLDKHLEKYLEYKTPSAATL